MSLIAQSIIDAFSGLRGLAPQDPRDLTGSHVEIIEIPVDFLRDTRFYLAFERSKNQLYGIRVCKHRKIHEYVIKYDGKQFSFWRDIKKEQSSYSWIKAGSDVIDGYRFSLVESIALRVLDAGVKNKTFERFNCFRREPVWENTIEEMKTLYEVCSVMLT